MKGKNKAIVVSCEHAGNAIPEKYKPLFKMAQSALNSHRGYDLGALDLFESIENNYIFHKQSATTSRLLVDINRSLHRKTLFSEFTIQIAQHEKTEILDTYYYSFRKSFEAKIRDLWKQDTTVLHLSVHSFTPVLNGKLRATDFGILYHPGRIAEKLFAKIWKAEITKILPGFRTRFNYPYSGKPDGHVRYYRDIETQKYLGIEFEMNQKYAGNYKVILGLTEAFNRASDAWINL